MTAIERHSSSTTTSTSAAAAAETGTNSAAKKVGKIMAVRVQMLYDSIQIQVHTTPCLAVDSIRANNQPIQSALRLVVMVISWSLNSLKGFSLFFCWRDGA